MSSSTFPYESQNSHLLDTLSAKTSQLKSITQNIYDNARSQDVLDNTNETFSTMGSGLKGSMGRMTRMAGNGDKVAVLKLSGMLIVSGVVVWVVGGAIWGWVFGR